MESDWSCHQKEAMNVATFHSSILSAGSFALQVKPGLVPTTVNVPTPVAENDRSSGAILSTQPARESTLSPEEKRLVSELAERDQEVHEHEQAHKKAGGRYIRGSQFQYKVGPDNHTYAINGEVSIDASPIRDDPDATISKMQVVRRAALAPKEPSPKDFSVANKASQTEQSAKVELNREKNTAAGPATATSNAGAETFRQVAADAFQTQPGSLVDIQG